MSFVTLDRRLRKLEGVIGVDDPRRYLNWPLVDWPDTVIERALEMGEERLAELMAQYGRVGFEP